MKYKPPFVGRWKSDDPDAYFQLVIESDSSRKFTVRLSGVPGGEAYRVMGIRRIGKTLRFSLWFESSGQRTRSVLRHLSNAQLQEELTIQEVWTKQSALARPERTSTDRNKILGRWQTVTEDSPAIITFYKRGNAIRAQVYDELRRYALKRSTVGWKGKRAFLECLTRGGLRTKLEFLLLQSGTKANVALTFVHCWTRVTS